MTFIVKFSVVRVKLVRLRPIVDWENTGSTAGWKNFYEADPLECPKCKGPMRVIALIEDAHVVRRILEHLGLWKKRRGE